MKNLQLLMYYSSNTVKLALKSRNKLRGSRYKMSGDQTKMEQEAYKAAKKSLLERENAGEENFSIQFRHVYYQNVGGLRTRLSDLLINVSCCPYDIIILVESNLNDNFRDSELRCDGFDVFRCDRSLKSSDKLNGGGVLIFVRSKLQSHYISINEDHIEQLLILSQFGKSKFIIGGTYIPPHSPREAYMEEIVLQYPSLNIYMFGDYNLPNAVWSNDEFGVLVHCPGADPAVDVAQAYGYLKFYQLNSLPNDRNVFLDLVFSNYRDLVITRAGDPLLNSSLHHFGYEASLMALNTSSSSCLSYHEFYYDFMNGNYFEFNNFLAAIDWQECLGYSDINVSTQVFNEILATGIAFFVSLKRYRSSSFPKWFSHDLRCLTREKKYAHSLYMKNRSDVNYSNFSRLRSECKRLSDAYFSLYIRGLDAELQNNPYSFWKYIRDKLSSHNLPDLKFYNERSASNGQGIANLFKDFFQTVYLPSNNDLKLPSAHLDSNIGACFNITDFTVTGIFDATLA
ncbi:uncharacterized protein LOC126885523 [Diabrotica virgifera virgifera]|uniref:Endonuclease/exonuclease/phosphatase domain-containing protein n=1 Tax=Diabrotica virgifera virgifera TaxID=50390 RepID=A0ABM5KCZ1_DIAVI|nr:uncharacterized protein LOC126885523 [Diabrotica virgifera virgifera]